MMNCAHCWEIMSVAFWQNNHAHGYWGRTFCDVIHEDIRKIVFFSFIKQYNTILDSQARGCMYLKIGFQVWLFFTLTEPTPDSQHRFQWIQSSSFHIIYHIMQKWVCCIETNTDFHWVLYLLYWGQGLFTRNVFFSPYPPLPLDIRIRGRMGPSPILSVIHTVFIGTMLNDSGGNSGHGSKRYVQTNLQCRWLHTFGQTKGLFTPNDPATVTVTLTGGTFDLFDGHCDGHCDAYPFCSST